MSHLSNYQRNYFARDEHGKIIALPMPMPDNVQSARKSACSAKKRGYIPIQPLKLDEIVRSPRSSQTKKRKVDKPIRKELFKVPPQKGAKKNSSVRKSITKTKPKGSVKKIKTALMLQCTSPLVDVDEAEKLLTRNSSRTVLFPFKPEDKENTPLKDYACAIDQKTPSSEESMDEFLRAETELSSVKKTGQSTSPVTLVCNLLEGTKLDNLVDDEESTYTTLLDLINEHKQQFELYKQQHEQRLRSITKLVQQLQSKSKHRRSARLAATNMKTNVVISPAVVPKVDLRKTTLKRNLKSSHTGENSAISKAIDLYNTMRSDCSVLCTPKMDRTLIVPEISVTRSLSRRVQQQCLALQETPKVLFK